MTDGRRHGYAHVAAMLMAQQAMAVASPFVTSLDLVTGSPNVDTNVTITGTGFTGASDINIGSSGSQPAGLNLFTLIAIDSDTTIRGTVAAAGSTAGDSYDVVVTAGDGIHTGTLADGFTIPLAGIDSILPVSGSHLGATHVAAMGWGFVTQNATNIKLGSNPPLVLPTFSDDANADFFTPAHAAGAVLSSVACDAGVLVSNSPVFTYT